MDFQMFKLVLEKTEEPEIKLPTPFGELGSAGKNTTGSTECIGSIKVSTEDPGDLADPGTEPASLALAGRFFTTEPPGEPPSVYSSL